MTTHLSPAMLREACRVAGIEFRYTIDRQLYVAGPNGYPLHFDMSEHRAWSVARFAAIGSLLHATTAAVSMRGEMRAR